MALSKIGTNSLEDLSVTSGKIANDGVGPTQLDETANYAFTGTITGAGESNTPAFQARKSSPQSLSGDVLTKITFDTDVFDADNVYDTSTSKFTVPSGQGGKYFYYSNINHTSGNTAKFTLYLYKNGSAFHETDKLVSASLQGLTWCNFIDLSAGDYLELYYYFHENPITGSIEGGTNQSFFGAYKIT